MLPHSSSLNPTKTKSSPTTIGRFTSIPSVASNSSCSVSVISGRRSFKFCSFYKFPLVLKNFFRGSPLFLYQASNSDTDGFCSLMWRASYGIWWSSSHLRARLQVLQGGYCKNNMFIIDIPFF